MSWNFDNTYFRELPGFYAPVSPSSPPAPSVVVWNDDLARSLGLSEFGSGAPERARVFSGADLPHGGAPIALAYAGHQFGHFSPQLGDGRAILLGEQVTPEGARFDIQLKGAGRTPFSRNGDGKYALGPALREHLISEAMFALGVSTTRSLAVTLTGENVARQTVQPGAILTRVAKSHIRIGTFQFFAAHLGADYVKRLADYAIARHYPASTAAANPYLALFEAVMDAQIRLIASWMHIGFVHGVMNTDNVAISGETIDFGPCAFLDGYSRDVVFSSIDKEGRYAFGSQPNICRWNMAQLGSAIAEVAEAAGRKSIERMNELLAEFPHRYEKVWLDGVRKKLGLTTDRHEDLELANSLFSTIEGRNIDYTNFFRNLAKVPVAGHRVVTDLLSDTLAIDDWLNVWQKRISKEPLAANERASKMNAANPLYIPRNHKVEEALAAAIGGDMKPYYHLLEAVTHPFEERKEWVGFDQGASAAVGPHVTYCGT